MTKSFNHQDLAKLFGRLSNQNGPVKIPSQATGKENDVAEEPYRKANHSLAFRNQTLKSELTAANQKVKELRDENTSLRERVAALEAGLDTQLIEKLVAERFQRKMAQFSVISERTVEYLTKSADSFKNLFAEMSKGMEPVVEKDVVIPKKKMSIKPNLPDVVESPLLSSAARKRLSENKEKITLDIESTPKAGPKKVLRPASGRRSQKRKPNVDDANKETSCAILATPSRNLKSEATDMETPAILSDTVRRKRAAATKITSFAEPSLHSKLRRPGKYDEPSPFVSQFM